MKKTSINKVKLGIFVTIGIAIFLAGIYFIGETKQLFSSTFRISALFDDVNGLQVGNNVRFAGINVGSIESIQIISDSTVKVDMIIDENTKKYIKKDSKAIIGTDGLMGNKIMVISAGTAGNKEIEHNDMIGTTKPLNIDDMLVKLKETGDNAALITGDLAVIFSSIRTGQGTVGKLFVDKEFANNLDEVMVNVKNGTLGFKNAFDQNFDRTVDSILNNVKNGTDGFKSTFDEKFANNVDSILINVKNGTNGFNKTMIEAQHSWLLGSFWGGDSDEDEQEKLKNEELEKSKELIKTNKLNEENSKTLNKEEPLLEKKKLNDAEKIRLLRIIKLYDEEVLREKNELLKKQKQDSIKKN